MMYSAWTKRANSVALRDRMAHARRRTDLGLMPLTETNSKKSAARREIERRRIMKESDQ